jgi:hypothetical protein
MRLATILAMALTLGCPVPCQARDADLWDYWEVGPEAGIRSSKTWQAGLALRTIQGGGGGFVWGTVGMGLDASYAVIDDRERQIRILPMVDLCIDSPYLQLGAGPALDLGTIGHSGVDLMLGVGIRFYLGKAFIGPALSIGFRLDGTVTPSIQQAVPSFFIQVLQGAHGFQEKR